MEKRRNGRRARGVLLVAMSVIATSGLAATSSAVSAGPGDVLYRVNAGSSTIAAVDGGPDWIADTAMSPPVRVAGGNKISGASSTPGATVPASTPAGLFTSERWDPSWGAEMAWEFPVAAGTSVEVRVYVADSYWATSQPGQRVFDLLVDGQVVADDLDISATFGHQVGGMVSTSIVSDGIVDIDFARVIQNPVVNGFEIIESGTPDPHTVTVTETGSGTVTLDPDLAVYEHGTTVDLTASAASGWTFEGWSGDLGGADNPATVVVDRDLVIDALFVEEVPATLTTQVVGNGSITVDPDQPTYVVGDEVELAAVPASGWMFTGWSGDLTGTANPSTVTMAESTDVTATFEAIPTYTLDVVTNGPGAVTVEPDQASYLAGDVVSVTAVPDPGASFTGWSGDLTGSVNPESITIGGDTIVTATFEAIPTYTLDVVTNGPGAVTVEPDQASYLAGDVVSVTAVPDPGASFTGWSGDLTGSVNPESITIGGDTIVTATFTSAPTYTLDVVTNGPGAVTVEPDQASYLAGDVVSVTAVPDPGASFTGWSGDLTGSVNPESITIGGDTIVTATFEAIPTYTLDVVTNGPGAVTVEPDQASYLAGDVVSVTAVPDPGASFTGWSGDLTGSVNPESITIGGDTIVTASFTADLVLAAIADQQVAEGETVVVAVSAVGPPGIALSANGAPAFVALTDNGDGTGTLTISPVTGDAGEYADVTVDAAASGQTDSTTFSITVTEPSSGPGEVLYRVNVGTTTLPAIDGGPDWIADADMVPPVRVAGGGSRSGGPAVPGATVPASTPAELFETNRWDPGWGAEMQWEFPVTAGSEVEVRVFVANSYQGTSEPGQRIFDILVEGSVVADDLDLVATFGHQVGGMVMTTVVSDGVIDIDFGHVVENPLVNGFEIVTSDGTNPPPLVLDSIGDITVTEGQTTDIPVTASGPTGIGLSLTGAPAFVTLSDAGDGTGTLTVAPSVGDVGVYPSVSVTAAAGSQSVSSTFTITVDEQGTSNVQYRVNAGGPVVASTDGGPDWSADMSTSPSPYVNHGTGNQSFFSVPAGTVAPVAGYPADLFQSERYDTSGGAVMQWEFPVAAGVAYDVTLFFSEKFASTSGTRVFDVDIEGQPVLVGFDPSVPVGVDVGVASTFVVQVADDYVTINFDRDIGNPNIDAIEISLHDGTTDVPPVVTPIDDVVVDAGTSIGIGVTATDQEPIVLSLTDQPGFVSLVDNGNGTGTITVAPAAGDTGTYPDVGLTATANGLSTTERFAITVDDPGGNPTGVLYRVNAGASTVASVDGGPDWIADGSMSPPVLVAGGQNLSLSSASPGATVPSSTPPALFSSERYDPSTGAEMAYEFAVPAGTQVEVRVFAGDGYSGTSSPGARVFDIDVDGSPLVTGLDLSGTYGPGVGAMLTTTIVSDGIVDIDFTRDVQNPLVNGFEILTVDSPDTLGASEVVVDFGAVTVGDQATQSIVLTNLGLGGDPTINGIAASLGAGPFSIATPPVATLAPGASTTMVVAFDPTVVATENATMTITHSGVNSPLPIALQGDGVESVPISFQSDGLDAPVANPTSLDFGPDDRLYVSSQNGLVKAFTIARNGTADYTIVATETISEIQAIVNHDDEGNPDPESGRQVTGLMTAGTASNPVLYVSSSDPRIAGVSGDAGLDTNSGVLSRLTWTGTEWDHVQLIRGLPRSEENHSTNGMDLDPATGTLYLQSGGFTNKGAPSNNFAATPEYALSAALLSVDLAAIEALPTLTDSEGALYKYDLPTLNDPLRTDRSGSQPSDPDADVNDPWGGNDGLNQAILIENGPVQVHASGFRNAFDVVISESGEIYTWDNGPNSGWGGIPVGNGTAACTNEMNEANSGGKPDGLHHVTGAGYYGGHPNPTRGNADSGIIRYVKSGSVWNIAQSYDWSDFPVPPVPASMIKPAECTYLAPDGANDALATVGASTNGITEYTASNFGGALQGNLLGASFNGSIYRSVLSPDGTALVSNESFLQGFGSTPLDVIALGDTGPYPGTIWAVTYGSNAVTVFEPSDFGGGGGGPTCVGGPGTIDEDEDGYTNDDELAAGTDPCNAGSKPADADGDFISDVTDPDDDNDGISDQVDAFAIDPDNGSSTLVAASCPIDFSDESAASCLRFGAGQRVGTILDLGITGVMSNGSDYLDLFDPDNMIVGGAAGALAVQQTSAGTPFGSANSAEYGLQFGVTVPNETFVIRTRVKSPFPGGVPEAGQVVGLQIGDGTQSEFLALTVSGDGVDGSIAVDAESGDVTTSLGSVTANDIVGSVDTDLTVTIDPIAGTVSAEYLAGNAVVTTVGSGTLSAPWSVPGSVMAIGLVSSSGSAAPFTASWDFLDVERLNPSTGVTSADFGVLENNNNIDASTFVPNSFSVTNTSTSGAEIVSVSYDLSTGWMSNMVFDPFGTAGDITAKGFTVNNGGAATGYNQFTYEVPHNGVDSDAGYDGLDVFFDDFQTSETFTFSIDVDPTSIKGDPAPGANASGSVSGLELLGATVTIAFSDGNVLTSTLFANGTEAGADGSVTTEAVPITPQISIAGAPGSTTSVPNHDLVVTGTAGATVRLVQTEAGLFLPSDLGSADRELGDPMLTNSLLSQNLTSATIGANGTVTIPVTLLETDPDGGFNQFAVVTESAGVASGSSWVVIRYTP